ncbi:choice-of-anchor J domain-containing protein [Flavobacterium sp. D11R37]|uniref:T9SS-dependent choice-of-anchor J family protein n=1 Tax=Flavobacterium coralii TaxID=2838017 RepID=UPI001CA63365|nr:choice-of-anchor J domain-containing protein [Flavobacterium coralii]MBY8963250.1 choice-of-anchor J domain-containing protein [Flavobacterium coralii]
MKEKLLGFLLLVFTGAYAQIPTEGFEQAFPPAGWTITDNGIGAGESWSQIPLGSPALPPYAGNYAAYILGEDVPTGTAEDWLISPAITVPPNGTISFYSRLFQNNNQGSLYRMMITNSDPQDLSAYTLLQQWTETEINPSQATYTQKIVSIPSVYTGTQVHIAFVLVTDDGDGWLVDEVSVTEGCVQPLNVMISEATGTELTVSWEDAPGVSDYEIIILPAGVPFTGNEQGIVTTSNSYVFTGLTEDSVYQVYIRSLCPQGGVSEWAGPVYSGILTSNTLSGTVTFDADGDDNCEEVDIVPFVPIAVNIDGLFAYYTYTDMNGEYTIYNIGDGESTIILQPEPQSFFPTVEAVTVSVNFDGSTTEETADICLPQPESFIDAAITLTPINAARPGFQAYYNLTVRNNGSMPLNNVTATVTFDDNRFDYTSSEGNSAATGNIITFTIGDLNAFAAEHYMIDLYTLAPPVNVGGEVVSFNLEVMHDETDDNPDDNTAVTQQTIINSWDPNDIIVHEGPEILLEQADDYLTYTIRFQNTGTASAINVRLENELEEKLDWDTFQPIAASHDYTVNREEGDLEFLFNDINLPDDESDEPGSHGFVTYRIKPQSTVVLGDIFYNGAGIFFDFNEPVITNTAETEIVAETSGLTDALQNKVSIYPNPVVNYLNINTDGSELYTITIYDLNGRKCLTGSGEKMDVSSLRAGLYLAEVTTQNGTSVFKLVKQ